MTNEIPLEVLKAVKSMNEEKFISSLVEGDSARAGESLKRMAYALSQIDQYKVENWVQDKQVNGDDGSGYCDGCAGCDNCVQLCGDHIVPIGECGCKL